jgi:hypothetical protein
MILTQSHGNFGLERLTGHEAGHDGCLPGYAWSTSM